MFNSVSQSKSCSFFLLLIPANLKNLSNFKLNWAGAAVCRHRNCKDKCSCMDSSAGESSSPDQLIQVKDEEQLYL